jgi:hypothetical protein
MPLGAAKQALLAAAGVATGDVVLLATQTASDSATLAFTSGINSDYIEYVFDFINMHPATDGTKFQCNFSIDGGSNYNVNKTSSAFMARHRESDASASLAFYATESLDDATGYQPLSIKGVNNDADGQSSGTMSLMNPSSTSYVKQYISRAVSMQEDDEATDSYVGGFIDSTSAVNAVIFQFASGNIEAGTIKMYGIK